MRFFAPNRQRWQRTLSAALCAALLFTSSPIGEAQQLADAISAIASTATLIAVNRQTQQANQQLLQQLNSQEAQQIQLGIQMAQLKLRNELTNALSCLQRNSVATAATLPSVNQSSLASAARNGGTTVLGRDRCTNPGIDLSVYDQEITCVVAERAEDQAKKDRDFNECRRTQLLLLQRVVGCLDGFDNKLKNASADLQKMIAQRTDYIKKVLTSYTQSIDGHKRASQLITQELDGPDGYKDQVTKLESLLATLDDAMSAPAQSAERTGQAIKLDNDTLEAGLEERVRHLVQTEQANVADSWFKIIVGGTQQCYQQASTPCTTATGAQSGLACLETLACQGLARGNGYDARCNQNKTALANVISLTASKFQFNIQVFGPNASPYEPQTIVNAANQERNRLLALIMSSFDDYAGAGIQRGFNPTTNMNQLKAKVQEQFDRCFQRQVSLFTQSFNTATVSSNNPFKSGLENLRRKQLEVEGDLDRWIRRVTGQMTKFRTKFTSVFDNTLEQFRSDCMRVNGNNTANFADGAQTKITCLKTLRERLAGGINGTNGEDTTVIQVPVIQGTPGAQGTNLQTIRQSCRGFKDCIQQLDVARRLHNEQSDTLKTQRQNQAQNHNQVIDGILSEVGARFAEAMTNMGGFQQVLNQVNNLLAGNDVAKRISLSARDTEELEKGEEPADDEQSRVYKAPKDILAVMAAKSGLPQITQESIDEVKEDIQKKLNGSDGSNGIQKRIEKANRVLASARDRLRRCTPTGQDWDAIAESFKNCDRMEYLCRRAARTSVGQLVAIGSKISSNPDDNKGNAGTDVRERNLGSYDRCMREEDQYASGGLSAADRATLAVLSNSQNRGGINNTRSLMQMAGRHNQCLADSMTVARNLHANAREDYRGRANQLLTAMDEMLGACDGYVLAAARYDQSQNTAERNLASASDAAITACTSQRNEKIGAGSDAFKTMIERIGRTNFSAISLPENERPVRREGAEPVQRDLASIPEGSRTAFTGSQDGTVSGEQQFASLRNAITSILQTYRSNLETRARDGRLLADEKGPERFLTNSNPQEAFAEFMRYVDALPSSPQKTQAIAIIDQTLRPGGQLNENRLRAVREAMLRSISESGISFDNDVFTPLREASRQFESCREQAQDNAEEALTSRDTQRNARLANFEDPIRAACENVRREAQRLATEARNTEPGARPGADNAFDGD